MSLALLASLGLLLPSTQVTVQGIATPPGPDSKLAPLLSIHIDEVDMLALSLGRIMLPALDKPGDPSQLFLVTDDAVRMPVATLKLAPEDRKGPPRYIWEGDPVVLTTSALLLCAPVRSTWPRMMAHRKLSRTLEVTLLRGRETASVATVGHKRSQGADPESQAGMRPDAWAAKIPALEPAPGAGHYRLPKGVWRLDQDLVIPRDVVFHIEGPTTLLLAPGRSIYAFGKLDWRGSPEAPINVQPAGLGPWGTVLVTGPDAAGSHFEGVRFVSGAGWFMTTIDLFGMVNVIDSEASFSHCRFEDALSEDALHAIRSKLEVADCAVSGTASDGIDLEGSVGTIERTLIEDIGDDGLDIGEESTATIHQVMVRRSRGKAISVGQRSRATVTDSFLLEGGRGISSFEGSVVDAERTAIAFMRRAAIQASARRGTEPGHATLIHGLLWQNATPKRARADTVVITDTATDIPLDLARYAPNQGRGPIAVIPPLPVFAPGAESTPRLLLGPVANTMAQPRSPLGWGLYLAIAVTALAGLLTIERRLRI